MKIQLDIVQGPASNRAFTIEENTRWIIGRDQSANIQIVNDELISREHCSIEFDGTQVTLTDLGSTNGTFLDGRPLQKDQPVYLKHGQKFVTGRVTVFAIQFVKEAYPTATPPNQLAPPLDATPGPALPPEQPQSKFGASIYQVGDEGPPVETPPVSQDRSRPDDSDGGIFSPSIRQEFIESDVIDQGLHDSDSWNQDVNRGQVENSHEIPQSSYQPPSSSAEPPPSSYQPPPSFDQTDNNVEMQDNKAGIQRDYGSNSIAYPGQAAEVDQGFAPLPGDNESSVTGPEVPARPIQSPPVPEQASDQPPLNKDATQQSEHPTPPVPGSIFAPGIEPAAPVRQPVADQTPDGRIGSIGLPHQIPVDQPQLVAERKPIQESIPQDKISFQVRVQDNGLHFHSGLEVCDVPKVLALLRKRFESVFCAHLSRVGLEPVDRDSKLKKSGPEDQSESQPAGSGNFEGLETDTEPTADESPFENTPTSDTSSATSATDVDSGAPKIGMPLFNWLPKQVRWEYPLLLTNEEFAFKIEDLWQQDALVCFFGSSAKQLIDHCQELIHTDLRTGKKTDSMFGFCWPTVLDGILESQSEKSVGLIFQGGVAAILLEDPQQELAWNIISKSDLSEMLTLAGFVRQELAGEG